MIALIMVAMTVAYPEREPRSAVGVPAAAAIGPKAISTVIAPVGAAVVAAPIPGKHISCTD
jgi:hypothetical protein